MKRSQNPITRCEPLEGRRLLAADIEVLGADGVFTTASDQTFQLGMGVHARANAEVLAAYKPLEYRYEWTFEDTGSSYKTLPGFNAAHFYSSTGNGKDIRLRIYNPATPDTPVFDDTVEVNIAASTRTTIKVAQNPVAGEVSLATAQDQMLTASNVNLLFRRSDVFELTTAIDTIGIGGSNVYVGSYVRTGQSTTDPAPVIQSALSSTVAGHFDVSQGSKNVTIEGLTFGRGWGGSNIGNHINIHGDNVTLKDNKFLNTRPDVMDSRVHSRVNNQGLLLLNNDSDFQRAYFLYAYGDDIVLLGNEIGNGLSSSMRTGSTDATYVLAYDNEFTNPPDEESTGVSFPTFRANFGRYLYVANNDFHNGQISLGGYQGESGGVIVYHGDVQYLVVENNQSFDEFEATPGTLSAPQDNAIALLAGARDVVIRNNVFEHTGRTGLDFNPSYGGLPVNNIHILHNTFLTRGGGTFMKIGSGANPTLYVRNNLGFGRSVPTGGTAVDVRDMTIVDEFRDNVWTVSATPASPGNIFKLNNGSSNVNLATWNAATPGGDDALVDQTLSEHATDESQSTFLPSSTLSERGVRLPFSSYDRFGNLRPSTSPTAGAAERRPVGAVVAPAAPSELSATVNSPTNVQLRACEFLARFLSDKALKVSP